MRDLDLKFESQDKLLNYMMQQVQTLEKETTDVRRKNAVLETVLREDRNKLESQIRHSGDSSLIGVQELSTKLSFMEEKMQADETERTELRKKL